MAVDERRRNDAACSIFEARARSSGAQLRERALAAAVHARAA